MFQKFWRIRLFFADEDPRDYIFNQKVFDEEYVLSWGDKAIKETDVVDYQLDEIWKKEDS